MASHRLTLPMILALAALGAGYTQCEEQVLPPDHVLDLDSGSEESSEDGALPSSSPYSLDVVLTDQQEALRAFADLHPLDERYIVARADETRVHAITAVLEAGRTVAAGEAKRDSVIAVFDAQGQLTGRMEGFGQQRGDLVERLRDLTE